MEEEDRRIGCSPTAGEYACEIMDPIRDAASLP